MPLIYFKSRRNTIYVVVSLIILSENINNYLPLILSHSMAANLSRIASRNSLVRSLSCVIAWVVAFLPSTISILQINTQSQKRLFWYDFVGGEKKFEDNRIFFIKSDYRHMSNNISSASNARY